MYTKNLITKLRESIKREIVLSKELIMTLKEIERLQTNVMIVDVKSHSSSADILIYMTIPQRNMIVDLTNKYAMSFDSIVEKLLTEGIDKILLLIKDTIVKPLDGEICCNISITKEKKKYILHAFDKYNVSCKIAIEKGIESYKMGNLTFKEKEDKCKNYE